MKDEISNFYRRDDNSRVTTGRRDTISRHGEKRQRRVLLDTLQNLHKKYNAEHHCTSISYSFCRLRPFHTVHPSQRDRQTCLCQKCENGQLMLQKLMQLNFISPASSLNSCASSMCC